MGGKGGGQWGKRREGGNRVGTGANRDGRAALIKSAYMVLTLQRGRVAREGPLVQLRHAGLPFTL